MQLQSPPEHRDTDPARCGRSEQSRFPVVRAVFYCQKSAPLNVMYEFDLASFFVSLDLLPCFSDVDEWVG